MACLPPCDRIFILPQESSPAKFHLILGRIFPTQLSWMELVFTQRLKYMSWWVFVAEIPIFLTHIYIYIYYIYPYSDNRVVVYTKAISELQVASVQKPLRGWSVSRCHTQLPSYMGVSLNGGTPNLHPKMINFLVGKKPMAVGETHHFLETPDIQIPMRFVVFFLGVEFLKPLWATDLANSENALGLLPWKMQRLEPTNHTFRKEYDLNQTSMIMFHVDLQGW